MVVERPISHPDPLVSVVIPTIPEYELKSLSALKKQTVERFEVIVVSDASIDRCEARNEGMREANGEIIAQTDDDCLPPESWVERIETHFRDDSDLVLVEGPLDKLRPPPRHYIGANLAYRREQALAIDGFDSSFSGWRADTDFGWRMEIEYGVDRCRHDPELEVFHDGPMRSDVDHPKERRLRRMYSRRYFTVLYPPEVPYGQALGRFAARCYDIAPTIGDNLVEKANSVRSNL